MVSEGTLALPANQVISCSGCKIIENNIWIWVLNQPDRYLQAWLFGAKCTNYVCVQLSNSPLIDRFLSWFGPGFICLLWHLNLSLVLPCFPMKRKIGWYHPTLSLQTNYIIRIRNMTAKQKFLSNPSLNTQSCNRDPLCSTFTFENP